MPIGETLTLLASLASALQAMRASRPTPETPVQSAAEVDALTLVTFDLVRTANDDAVRLHEAASERLNAFALLSGAALLVSAFLGAMTEEAPEGASPLFIASICIFVMVVTAVIVLRRVFGVTRLSHQELSAAPQSLRLEAIAQAIEQGRETERGNRARVAMLDVAGDVMLLLVALQAVLAAVWLIS